MHVQCVNSVKLLEQSAATKTHLIIQRELNPFLFFVIIHILVERADFFQF